VRYAELRCKSNFSFLRGASHADELVDRAAELGYYALAITDRNTLAGAVRMHGAVKNLSENAESQSGAAADPGGQDSSGSDQEPLPDGRGSDQRSGGRCPPYRSGFDSPTAEAMGHPIGRGSVLSGYLKLLIGAEIVPEDAGPILLYATDRASYGRLARLISRGCLRRPKGECAVRFDDIAELAEGMIGIMLDGDGFRSPAFGETASPHRTMSYPSLGRGEAESDTTDIRESARTGERDRVGSVNRGSLKSTKLETRRQRREPGSLVEAVLRYREVFGERLYVAAEAHGGTDDARRLAAVAELSRRTGVPMVAVNDVHYHEPKRRFLQDVVTCIREHCTLADAGRRLFANGERYLKSPEQMARLFHAYPQALARTIEVADRCSFSLDELRYEYPEELCPPDQTPRQYLAELTWRGARERFPGGVPEKVRGLLEHELRLIEELSYEPYFLTVWDLVRFARSRGILCQGRGSAANSAVCYVLGVTNVDPERIDVLFERFVSKERNEPPDIDVDFEHERREEVFAYIYEKYGRERAGIVAEVITYRPRSAVRDVGKALGLSRDRVDLLAKKLEWWGNSPLPGEVIVEAGLDPADRTIRLFGKLVKQIVGFPRHLSQHVGGFVITQHPLCELVPIENGAMPGRTFIEWDKDDIDALGILKVDCLALGMLTAVGRCFRLLCARRDGEKKGSRDQGKKGSRDQGIKGIGEENKATQSTGDIDDGKQGDVSRPHRVAKSDRVDETPVPGDARNARIGEIRADATDATGSGLGGQQHRGGQCTPNTSGLCSLPFHCAGFTRRAGNTTNYRKRAANATRYGRFAGNHSGSEADAPGSHEQPAKDKCPIGIPHLGLTFVDSPGVKTAGNASAAFLDLDPSTPHFLDPSIPSSLDPSIPRSLDPFLPSSLSDIPPEDPLVYDMICRADTVGVFQIESRAQMSMLPRLRPRCFYDLVIEVAIVRPGPIQGGMVHPYLRRRNGEEAVTFPNEALAGVLGKTLGVPLFQEQAMRLAVVAGGFTPGEADQLRRAMGAWRRQGAIEQFRSKLIRGMLANGLTQEFAERCFEQIAGFGEYGFPESHAASFALLVYVSAWLKRYHPAAFTAALLNSQQMGFYAPAQLVRDAREHGVEVRPVDVNASGWDCGLEERHGGTEEEGTKARRHGDRKSVV